MTGADAEGGVPKPIYRKGADMFMPPPEIADMSTEPPTMPANLAPAEGGVPDNLDRGGRPSRIDEATWDAWGHAGRYWYTSRTRWMDTARQIAAQRDEAVAALAASREEVRRLREALIDAAEALEADSLDWPNAGPFSLLKHAPTRVALLARAALRSPESPSPEDAS